MRNLSREDMDMNYDTDYWQLIGWELQHSKPDLEYLKQLERDRNQKILTLKMPYPTTKYFQGKTIFERLGL